MGKAFVAKLAKEGARDPEALAAWIGRKKHGAKAFRKLAAAGRKKQSGQGAKSSDGAARKKPASAPQRSAARDLNRGFKPGTASFAVSDSELQDLRRQAKFNRGQLSLFDAAGAKESAAETRKKLAEQERQIADAEYARETAVGQRAYSDSVQAERAGANALLSKARSSNDPDDWAAASAAADAFSRKAGESPYGAQDAGWYRSEAASAREAKSRAERAREVQAARRREQTLPPPKPGETPVAHVSSLSDEGGQSFGDPEMGRKAISRSPLGTVMPDTGAEGHETALKNVSPAFRKKVAQARASGRPWLHHISYDSGGGEIHELQTAGPDGKLQKTTFLERNTKAWKAKEAKRWASR